MRIRYTYLGAHVIEVVIDGDSVEVNIVPTLPAGTQQPPAPVAEQPQPVQATVDPPPAEVIPEVLPEEAPPEAVLAAAGPVARAKPAAQSGLKAGLASFMGMLAAGLLYVQENFGSLSDISLKNIALIAGGAILSGLLYFSYRYYRPSQPPNDTGEVNQ